MVFRHRPFIEPKKGEVQGFWSRTEVESKSNRDDVIINKSLNIDIKFIKLEKLTIYLIMWGKFNDFQAYI